MKPEHSRTGRRVHLHRALSKLGWGSRKEGWEAIVAGKVRVDGKVVTNPLTWVDLDGQKVTRAGEAPLIPPAVVLALHKPLGVLTTRRDERGRRTVYDLLPPGLPYLHPAGRLDADSEGLLILTNDSSLSASLTDPRQHLPKTYHVTVAGTVSAEALDRLRAGVDLADGLTRPAQIRLLRRVVGVTEFEIVLTEGRNRQIRRMAAAVGHKVRRLVRVAIGGLVLGDLPPGQFRVLDDRNRKKLTRC
jgi:23S rRNA pseudouridine2605 synthase